MTLFWRDGGGVWNNPRSMSAARLEVRKTYKFFIGGSFVRGESGRSLPDVSPSGQLWAGVVWANSYNQFDPGSPFRGHKESGLGREGGRQGLAAFVQSSWPDGGRWFAPGAFGFMTLILINSDGWAWGGLRL
jgi:hypothetical protein